MISQQASKMRQRNGRNHSRMNHMVPLASLLNCEIHNEKVERPIIRFGIASQSKKGEDYTFARADCQRMPGDGSSTFDVFAILDGHNGAAAAIYTKENLLNNVMSAIPPGLSRDDWLVVLPRALVAGFVKTDKEFQQKERSSGTTVTFVVVDRWTITVASVGDSRCILESQGGALSMLTVDHRLEENIEERERVIASGGEVARLNIVGGTEIGPLRCWPGGLCLSRSIGDMDVGEFIVPIPYVKQIKLSNTGGRLIIASDGVWDSLSCERAAKCCRGLPADPAAKQVVKEALRTRGLRDDTTCLIVDLMPPENSLSEFPCIKKPSKFKSFFVCRKPRESSAKLADRLAEAGIVEEIFEQGSAMLAERLDSSDAMLPTFGIFNCVICQVDITSSEGISVHAGSIFSTSKRPWEGPFLCLSCKTKKDAMEGKVAPNGLSHKL